MSRSVTSIWLLNINAGLLMICKLPPKEVVIENVMIQAFVSK